MNVSHFARMHVPRPGLHRLSAAQLELGEVEKALQTVVAGLKKEPSNADLTRLVRIYGTK